ncbi:ABC transporter substrate-binding protein [Mesorhizobium australafricanum]|uniref:ABC transporter substrate-binding protein n=1 Tax=Mesorhizobium australafricanum TaxID=3072311 RepID=A0ABU4X5L0_9HYPH|nr:ABC transporter substrate-binding protein [Mesorhizobium sp. VK3E]MDX8443329.1 ABC transporter substrate-binding protein [Mesorhizobium sp. VK3E]
MSMKLWEQVSVIALLVAVPVHAFAADTIKYGLVSAFSGPAAAWGSMEEVNDQLAIEDINAAGGINVGGKSYKLELVKYDHAYDPTKAVTVVRQAVQQDGVKYLEVMGGGVIPAIQPITEPNKVLIFGVAGGDSWIGQKTPNTFKPYYSGLDAALAMLTAAKEKNPNIKSVLAMYPDDELGHSNADALSKAVEKIGTKFNALFTARDVTDFYPVALKVMQEAPDVIDLGVTPGSQATEMVKQLRENGYQGIFIFSDTVDKDAMEKAGVVESVAGGYSAPYWSSFDSEKGKSWMDRYRQRYGSLQMWTGQQYDNLWLLKAAIEKAGTFEDTAKVAEALGEVSVDGLGGKVSYGGKATYGLPRAFVSDIPVGEIGQDGASLSLKQVYVYKP